MKKIAAIIAAMVLLIAGSTTVIAQNHRHIDRENTEVVDSVVASNASDTNTDEFEIGNFDFDMDFDGNDITGFNNDDADSIAKIAIVAVFGTLSLLFLAPVLILAIVLYFVYKRKTMKDKITLAAIEKGVEIPTEKTPTATNPQPEHQTPDSNPYTKAEKTQKEEKPLLHKGIMKVAVGLGLIFVGKIFWSNILGAAGLLVAMYGAGQIIIAYISNKDKHEKPE
ncbi:MAG: hypothetical protein KBT20_05890 [Bacteroidales bacterium]|nr:hypothetical protein [Candidatus Liminaster caballi]